MQHVFRPDDASKKRFSWFPDWIGAKDCQSDTFIRFRHKLSNAYLVAKFDLFLKRIEGACLLAYFDTAENESVKVSQKLGQSNINIGWRCRRLLDNLEFSCKFRHRSSTLRILGRSEFVQF